MKRGFRGTELVKILERLIYARVETIIDSLLPQEQGELPTREVGRRPGHHVDTGHRG